MPLAEIVAESMRREQPEPRDAGTAALALTYATAIDEGGDLTRLGPLLLAALEALLMSPRARAAVKKAVTSDKPSANPLDDLAARRRARTGPAPTMDSAAP